METVADLFYTVADTSLKLVDDLRATDDRDKLLAARAFLEDMKQTILFVTSECDTRLLDTIPKDEWYDGEPILLPGGGIILRSGGKEVERYDQHRIVGQYATVLTNELVDHYRVIEMDTGNVLEPEELLTDVIEPLVSTMADATGATAPSFTSWRSGVAKKNGVDIKAGAVWKTTDVKLRVEGRDRSNL